MIRCSECGGTRLDPSSVTWRRPTRFWRFWAWRDVDEVTQPDDTWERLELRNLHVALDIRVPLPTWVLHAVVWFRRTRQRMARRWRGV
jgi:hypothetical protein